jgi:hypothetical protein
MDAYAGLFYGNHYTSTLTLMKSLLLYNEVHFLDSAAITIKGKFGSVGRNSPYRNLPSELKEKGAKIICHSPLSGWITEPLRSSIAEDMKDIEFTKTFIRNFFQHESFSLFFLSPKGRYATQKGQKSVEPFKTGQEIKEAMSRIDWSEVRFDFERLESSEDGSFLSGLDTKESHELRMHWFICEASHLLNSFMISTIGINAVPFTDIRPYHELLLVKYARARKSGAFELPKTAKISYIAHTILDGILTLESFKKRSIEDILEFRNRHKNELQTFRQYLANLQNYIENEVFTPKFEKEILKFVNLEILPKAKELRNDLEKSWGKLFGSLIKRVSAAELTALAMIILKGIPLDTLVTVGPIGALSPWLVSDVVNFIKTRKKISRNNGLAYLLKF